MLRMLKCLVLSVWLGSSLIISVQAGDWDSYLSKMENALQNLDHFAVGFVVDEQRGEMVVLSSDGGVGIQGVVDGSFTVLGARCSNCVGGTGSRTVCVDLENTSGSGTNAYICNLQTVNIDADLVGISNTIPNSSCGVVGSPPPVNPATASIGSAVPAGGQLSFVARGDATGGRFSVFFSLSSVANHANFPASTACQ